MAYYTYSNVTREIVEISDFPLSPGDDCATSEINISMRDLTELYQWDSDAAAFKVKIVRTVTKKEFIKRFTPTEYSTIKAATASNGTLDYYWQLFMLAESISLDDNDTVVGVFALEQYGLINPGRAAEILS